MFRLPESAQKVIDIYESFDWQEVVQMPITQTDFKSNKTVINQSEVVSFGTSSYVGLHKDERLLNGGIDAMKKHGILHSSSRSYTYNSLTDEFESYLSQIFGLPTLAIIQTTMAHFSAMQLLMLPTDVAIIDMQAHATLQNMIQLPKSRGMKVEGILHNDINLLEKKIVQNQDAEKVWYVCDGVYSMYGDTAPVQDLIYLLEKYDNFYIYFDDAHGMSWTGPNGAGYVWKYLPMGHPKVIMATSLGKGFGIGGGALICPNPDIKKWMTRAGGGFVFCTQLHTQMLGSGIASAKIHLSDEIYMKQDIVLKNIQLFIEEARINNLPVLDYSETPVFYLNFGSNDFAININQKLRALGYYGNLGIYPAVPYKNAGMRISITSEHSSQDIIGLVNAISIAFKQVLKENNKSLDEFYTKAIRSKALKVA